jgi:hypothetical protein
MAGVWLHCPQGKSTGVIIESIETELRSLKDLEHVVGSKCKPDANLWAQVIATTHKRPRISKRVGNH